MIFTLFSPVFPKRPFYYITEFLCSILIFEKESIFLLLHKTAKQKNTANPLFTRICGFMNQRGLELRQPNQNIEYVFDVLPILIAHLLVKLYDALHVLIRQFKIKNIIILRYMFRIRGTGDCYKPCLKLPSKYYLGG